MFFYFKIAYETKVNTFFFRKSVKFAILSVSIVCENGQIYTGSNLQVRAFRKELGAFLNECLSKDREREGVYFIGHYCATEHLLLEAIYPFRDDLDNLIVIEMMDDYNELAAFLPDSCFGIESEYTVQKYKLESDTYSLSDKLEMIASHPDYPDIDYSTTLEYAQWIKKAYNFPLLQTHLIGRGIHAHFKNHSMVIFRNEPLDPEVVKEIMSNNT